jgi:hypothetical protein
LAGGGGGFFLLEGVDLIVSIDKSKKRCTFSLDKSLGKRRSGVKITVEHSKRVYDELLSNPKAWGASWERYLAKEHPEFFETVRRCMAGVTTDNTWETLSEKAKANEAMMIRITVGEILGPLYFAELGAVFSGITREKVTDAIKEIGLDRESQELHREQITSFMSAISLMWGSAITDAFKAHQFTPTSRCVILSIAKVVSDKVTDDAARA